MIRNVHVEKSLAKQLVVGGVKARALEAFLHAQGDRQLRRLSGVLCGLHGFNFTVGLVVVLSFETCERRYCYEHLADAHGALGQWDGSGHPPGPWIKCKGAGIDLLDPALRA